jgi:single-strand DNA-binding protein
MASLTTHLTIAGNLTRDIELRYTQAGQPVASFSIATTPRTYDKDTKQYVDGEAIFTNCTLWGKPAEHLAASVSKGSRVIASGSLKSRTYQTNAGETKTSTDLVIDEIGISVLFAPTGGRAPIPTTYPATGGPTAIAEDETPW